MGESRRLQGQLCDVGGHIPPLSSYWFLGVAGDVTIAGYYVDVFGDRTGDSFTGTINGDAGEDPTCFSDIQAIPQDATGFLGTLSGAVWMDLSKQTGSERPPDFKANRTQFVQVAASNSVRLGRVNG